MLVLRERMAAQRRVLFEEFSEGEAVFFERLRRFLARLYKLQRGLPHETGS